MNTLVQMLCKGKVAIVTGAAGKGMGRSIALTLAREGAKVTVNYRQSDKAAREIVDYIRKNGGEAIAVRADISDYTECEGLVRETKRKYGQVDICVINPGAGWHEEPIDKLNIPGALDDINREVAPVYNLMPLLLPEMYARKWGRFIGISMLLASGIAAMQGGVSPSFAYDAAKAARTHAMLRACSEAWRHNVTINIISPGPVAETASLEEAVELSNKGQRWQERNNTTPQDIAEGVAWLCSDAARFVTGCELPYMYY